MKTLRKRLIVTTLMAGLGLGGAAALAGPWGGGADCPMHGGKGYGRMGGDPEQRMAWRQQRHAERMELLEARLKLKPEQQTAWKGFLTAQESQRAERMKMWQDRADRKDSMTLNAHFEERTQALEQRLAGLKTMAKAAGELYAALDTDQKQVMDQFFADRPMRGMRGMRGGPAAPPATAQ